MHYTVESHSSNKVVDMWMYDREMNHRDRMEIMNRYDQAKCSMLCYIALMRARSCDRWQV